MLYASSYGQFIAANEFWSQRRIIRFWILTEAPFRATLVFASCPKRLWPNLLFGFNHKTFKQLINFQRPKHPENIPQTSTKYSENTTKTSSKHHQNIQKTSPKHPENITKTYRNHHQNIQKTSPKHTTKTSRNITKKIQKASPKHPEHIPKNVQKALLNASRSTCFCAKPSLMRRDQHVFAQNLAYCVAINMFLNKTLLKVPRSTCSCAQRC